MNAVNQVDEVCSNQSKQTITLTLATLSLSLSHYHPLSLISPTLTTQSSPSHTVYTYTTIVTFTPSTLTPLSLPSHVAYTYTTIVIFTHRLHLHHYRHLHTSPTLTPLSSPSHPAYTYTTIVTYIYIRMHIGHLVNHS